MITKIQSHRKFTYKIIQWEITNFCNYDCFYCGLHNKKNKKQCENFKQVINYFNKNIPDSIFPTIPQLFGGEPTLHQNFWEICDSFTVPFGIYTNLYKSIDFWKKLLDNKNLHHIYSTLHFNSIKNINEYLKKIKYISSILNDKFTLNIMLESDNKEIIDIYNQYKNSNIICVLTKIPESNIKINISPDYIHKRQYFDIFENKKLKTYSSFEYDNIDEINTKNFKCSTINYFNNIDINGNITNYCRRNIITNVYKEEYDKINKKYIICKSNFCPKYCYVIGTKEKLL